MTTSEKVIKNKLGLLELSQQLGNVSRACKIMGYSRDSFYRFKGYSMWAYLKVVACLLYVVSPFDLVPDFFPWVGWLDDIAVVIYVCGLVKEELDQFSVWQARQHLSTEY